VWKVKISVSRRKRGNKEYAERRITVPVDYPSMEYAVLLTPEEYEKLSTGNQYSGISGGIPLEEHAVCRARKMTAKAYYIECKDGRKAFVPEETLVKLVERFGDSIVVEK